MAKASAALLVQLAKSLEQEKLAKELQNSVKGLIVFNIDGDKWTLDLRRDSKPSLSKEASEDDMPDLTLTCTDAVFCQLVAGKLNPQTAFLTRRLKISGSMGMAMKLQPVLDAAAPKAKL